MEQKNGTEERSTVVLDDRIITQYDIIGGARAAMVSFINTKWNIYYVKSILKEQPIAALALCLLLYYIASKNILSVIFLIF